MQEQTQNGPIYDIQRMTIKRRSTTHSKEILSERGWGCGDDGGGGGGEVRGGWVLPYMTKKEDL